MDPERLFEQENNKASFPCAVCGVDMRPAPDNRCEACGRFACRSCLKIHYHTSSDGRVSVTQTLCYNCYHSKYEKPYAGG